ncbi:hypothetical protein KVV02_002403 [Mortierella alpina]|uniref:Uncharacterized protein n=1 Tax=Mortierella alpina TaxID=64518 RepID=A0A9P8A2S7_MORAP|nr:hypothetical protein KVV02_002403 [Mortierella alpina]
MKSFQQHASERKHQEASFDKLYQDYCTYVGRKKAKHGDASRSSIDIDACRAHYNSMLIKDTVGRSTASASKLVNKSVECYTQDALSLMDKKDDSSFEQGTKASEPANPESGETSESTVPQTNRIKRKRALLQQETQEPWHSLTLALIDAVGVNGVKKPHIPPVPTNMPSDHKALFKHARDCIKEYLNGGSKETILIKDAMVSMSSVLNLFASGMDSYFSEVEMEAAREACLRRGFEENNAIVQVLSPLREVLQKRGMEQLQHRVISLRGEVALRAAEGTTKPGDCLRQQVLMVIETLCTLIMDPPYGTAQASEADCLYQWKTVFSALKSKNITIHTGEQILNASKVVKKGLQLEFGDMAESGRRCDLFFRSGAVELANIEIKSPTQSGSVPICQNRKNVRLNRCIQLALEELGMEDATVIGGDIVGYLGYFYSMQKFGDIHVCGPISSEVVFLPTNAAELEDFLDGRSLSVIFNFLRSLDELTVPATNLRLKRELRLARGNMMNIVGPRSVTPPPKAKRLSQTVILTPTKKRIEINGASRSS